MTQQGAVDHPAHYNAGKIEVIEAIRDWGLCFWGGNVVKYVARARHKGKLLQDLRKARWYLDDWIKMLEAEVPLAEEEQTKEEFARADQDGDKPGPLLTREERWRASGIEPGRGDGG